MKLLLMITIWNQHKICEAPMNEFQSFFSHLFLFLIFLIFLLKSFFPANLFLFTCLVLYVDSLSLISFFPQHGWEIIYWSKGKLPMAIAMKKMTPFPSEPHTASSPSGRSSPNHDKMYEKC